MMLKIMSIAWVVIALLSISDGARADFTFLLEPGATITPTDGTAEVLTGSLVLRHLGPNGVIEAYDAIELNLSSPSFSISLNASPANDVATGLFPDGTAYFTEVVDATGLAHDVLTMASYAPGSHTGAILDPRRLAFSDVRLSRVGGGFFEARIDFTAAIVPEPSFLVLASLSVVGLWAIQRNTRPVLSTTC